MTTSEASVPTTKAVSYMKQLCRHWAHKFPVEFDDQAGRIEMTSAVVTMQCSPEDLRVRLETPGEENHARLQTVVAEHLQRFGFREQLQFDWKPVGAAA